jgi:hypothetical protein
MNKKVKKLKNLNPVKWLKSKVAFKNFIVNWTCIEKYL